MAKFQDPPIRSPFFPQQGVPLPSVIAKLVWIFSFPWIKYFQNISATLSALPVWPAGQASSAADIGFGLAKDANFLYVYTGTTWKRVPLNSF